MLMREIIDDFWNFSRCFVLLLHLSCKINIVIIIKCEYIEVIFCSRV